MKCFVITHSRLFPSDHPRKGESTGFIEKLISGEKIHTIRGNYPYWKNIAIQVNSGSAYLSRRYWEGKPYCSKQVEVDRLYNIEVLPISPSMFGWTVDGVDISATTKEIAANDGLNEQDFCNWFTKAEWPMAIIYYTDFRYKPYPHDEIFKENKPVVPSWTQGKIEFQNL